MTVLHKFAIVFALLSAGWLLEVVKQLLVLHVHP